MKTLQSLIAALALTAPASFTFAQEDVAAPPAHRPIRARQHRSTGDAETVGPRHPRSPVIGVLDQNADGVIDAAEIQNASAALQQLDENGDGQLTVEEFAPKPLRRGGPPAGAGRRHAPGCPLPPEGAGPDEVPGAN
jgi:hypothetical protein